VSKLPSISGRDNPFAQVVVPNHQELAKGTLRTILSSSKLDITVIKPIYSYSRTAKLGLM
jgi:hypothetical protein